MARKTKPRKARQPGRKTLEARGRRMLAVHNVAVEMLVEENPELLYELLSQVAVEARYRMLYALPGRTLTELHVDQLVRLHVVASRLPPS